MFSHPYVAGQIARERRRDMLTAAADSSCGARQHTWPPPVALPAACPPGSSVRGR
jgi:hypothetical protein